MTDAHDKLRCAMRELAYRHRVYPRLVAARKMSQAQADREIDLMSEIVEDYAGLAAKDEPRGLFDPPPGVQPVNEYQGSRKEKGDA